MCTEPQHGDDAGEDDEDVEHGVGVGDQRQLELDEVEELEQHEDRIEQVKAQEGAWVNEDTIHVLSAKVHQANS